MTATRGSGVVAYPVVAAIDFGTHGTGYAWTEVDEDLGKTLERKPYYNDKWPGMSTPYPKDLSAVLLAPDGRVIMHGYEARREWARLSGSGDSAGYHYASAFKMALKADAYGGITAPGAGSVVVDSPAKAYPLLVSCLRQMYQKALKEIQGSGYLEKQVRWCLTVPAIWDEEQKRLMRTAAAEAGMPTDRDRLLLALEPEAAAIYCQQHLARVLGTQRDSYGQVMTAGNRFMVIDCGGGTVDITAFRVTANPAGWEELVQICSPSGGKLGSEYVNEAFIHQVLRDRFGGPGVIDRIRSECPLALHELVQSWESAKVTAAVRRGGPEAEPEIDRAVYLPIPGEIGDLLTSEASNRLGALPSRTRHRIAVLPEEVKKLFDTVIDQLIELIDKALAQMIADNGPQAGPERLLLAGGFAQSDYLQERLRWHFGDRVTLLLPPDPAATVLFGAVLFGCNPPVIRARKSRYTYGCAATVVFDPARDPRDKMFTDEYGTTRCRDRFSTFAVSGETIEADHAVTREYAPSDSSDKGIAFDFYRTSASDPRYIDEPGCEKIGELEIDLGSAMMLPFRERAVTVEMNFGDTDISVSAVNSYTGQRVLTTLRFDTGI